MRILSLLARLLVALGWLMVGAWALGRFEYQQAMLLPLLAQPPAPLLL